MQRPKIPFQRVSRALLTLNIVMAFIYFSWWFKIGHLGNPWLYGLLFFGEIYHVLMALLFWFTLWPAQKRSQANFLSPHFNPTVDIFITVAGEPVEVVGQTALAARNLNYYNHKVHLLNDGYVAQKDNWQEIENLRFELGINCITRKIPGGAKAGNINNALKHTFGQIVVIFDADMVPHPDFLQKVIPYFQDSTTGFVQSPQYYKNYFLNQITGGSWEQQELFFGPIMKGKEKSNSTFICGTNVAIRREALLQAGGMCEDNIAEDFLTSLKIHQNGWKSYYIDEVLAEGLAPEDMLSYYKQQLRWARGSLEVLFSQNPFLKKGLSLSQKLQYLSSALYYFNGVIVFIDITAPLLFLYFGLEPVSSTTTSFAVFFVPFMFLSLYTLYIASGKSITFRAISYSQSSFTLQLQALRSVLFKQKMAFAVTPKQAQSGNFLFLAYPHLIYVLLSIGGVYVAVSREGVNPSLMTNIAWALFNIILFTPFILASNKWGNLFNPKEKWA